MVTIDNYQVLIYQLELGDYTYMKTAFENEIRSLQSWIDRANSELASVGMVTTDFNSVNNICYQINVIADGVTEEYPFYATELRRITGILFMNAAYGAATLNNAAFGELFIIIRHIINEPINMAMWQEIHPRIAAISQGLFCDGYPDSAAEKAVK